MDPHARIAGLDAWRAALMLIGLLLHATTGQESYPPFAVINIVSGSFRMGSFFLIAGLLSGAALARRPAGTAWLRGRLVRIGLPTVFGLAVICPLTGLAMQPGGGARFNVYHLWFLIALIFYTPIAFVLHGLIRPAGRSASPPNVVLVLVGTGCASFLLYIILSPACAAREAAFSPYHWAPATAGHLPMFLLGLALAWWPGLATAMTADRRPAVAILTAVIALHLWWMSPLSPTVPPCMAATTDSLILIAGGAWAAPAAATLILRSAMSIRRVSPVITTLSEASLTIYLFHYPVMAAIHRLIARWGWHPWTGYLVTLTAGGAASWAIHHMIVRRSRWALLIVDGRRGRGSPARPRDSGTWPESASGELLLPGAPRTAGIPFCCPVGSDRAILE